MDETFQQYAETTAFFDLVSSSICDNFSKNIENDEARNSINEKLENCWIKLQCLIEADKKIENNCFSALAATQSMLKILCEKFQLKVCSKAMLNDSNKDKFVNSESSQQRCSAIESTIFKPGEISFKDIAGLEEAKTLLQEAIILPLQYPHLFVGKRKPWRSILLYGPPGTGKSRMAEAIASESQAMFYSVSSSDLLSSWFGESEKLVKELFEHARTQNTRAIVFIDEIDSLCRKRDSKEAEATRRIKTELLKQIEGASDVKGNDIFFLCATNCPWELDTAFLRRFEKRIYIPLPGTLARRQLIGIHLGDFTVELSEDEWQLLLDQTEGYSGSDLATCVSDALLEPIRELRNVSMWKWSEDRSSLKPAHDGEPGAVSVRMQNIPNSKIQPRPVSYDDIRKALKVNRCTVSPYEMQRYEEFTSTFGQLG